MTTNLKGVKYKLMVPLLLFTSAVFSQSNFYKFGIGASAGVNRPFADLREYEYSPSFQVNAIYFLTPFITTDLEAQAGKIRGGNRNTDPRSREFINSYSQYTFNAKVYAGQFLTDNKNGLNAFFKHLYVGAGAGVIFNKMEFVDRTDAMSVGKDKGGNLTTPFNIGYDVNLGTVEGMSRFVLNINLQHNITYGEGLDGYNDSPLNFNNKYPDMFTVLSLGVKYNFGSMGLFYKPSSLR